MLGNSIERLLLELFFILSFHTLAFVCYNWLVAHYTGKVLRLTDQLRSVSVQQTKEVIHDLTDIFKGEEQKVILTNKKELSELLDNTATDQDYEFFLDKVVELVRDLYQNYQFLRQDPAPEDYESGYFLAFQIIRGEYPEAYDMLFRVAIDRGLDPVKINELFVQRLADGKVLPLGEAVIYQAGSGISSILQGHEMRVNITFAPQEYYEKGRELAEERVKKLQERSEEQAKIAKQKDEIMKSMRVASALLDELVDEVAEKHEMQELVKKIREGLGY